jgi:hypothetical protein
MRDRCVFPDRSSHVLEQQSLSLAARDTVHMHSHYIRWLHAATSH